MRLFPILLLNGFCLSTIIGCTHSISSQVSSLQEWQPAKVNTTELLDVTDSRLLPFCDKLAQLTTASSAEDIYSIFGESDPGLRFISSAYESVHKLANGGQLRIIARPNPWQTSANYIPPDSHLTKGNLAIKLRTPISP